MLDSPHADCFRAACFSLRGLVNDQTPFCSGGAARLPVPSRTRNGIPIHRELARCRECSDSVLSRRRLAGTAKPHCGSPRLRWSWK